VADVVVVGIFQSHDPNEMVGPTGIGPERYAGATERLSYTVYFENLPTATAPAGKVELTSLLGPEYDLSTFRLRRLVIGGVEVAVPVNKSFFRQVVGLQETSPDMEYTAGVRVDPMTGGGEVFWYLQTVDPDTGTPILNDPLVGILPPEDGTGAGRGFVEFTVRPSSAYPSGTRLETSARIVFDENEVIETGVVFNTLDADPPASTVALESLDVEAGLLTLSLSGADAPNGAGLGSFVIRTSVDGSQYAAIGETGEESFVFQVERGRTYAFFSQAVDLVGNEEPAPEGPLGEIVPDLVVTVPPLRPLVANVVELDTRGGTQILVLNAGPENAGRGYRILGSMSGSSPGASLGGLHVPLNQDDYFRDTLRGSGEIPITGATGVLDELGRAEVRIDVSAALARELVGATLHHTFVLEGQKPPPTPAPKGKGRVPADGTRIFDYASNAEPLRLELQRGGHVRSATSPP
jgi:hypothetical protein